MHDHDRGLAHDLPRLMGRRRALSLFGAAGAAGVAVLVGCGSDGSTAGGSTSTTAGAATGSTAATGAGASTGSAAGSATAEIPEETAGPFPGDGSNGPNVLDDSGIVRSDITASYGGSTTVAEGVPLTLVLDVTEAGTGGARAGAAVYVWHCNRAGEYSLYSPGVENENYLRGVQEADDDGRVTFTSIFPAAYPGRWPHVHVEVYESLDAVTSSGGKLATSQVALPADVCDAVYATSGYEQSVDDLAGTSLAQDMVFADDGAARQLATMAGAVGDGLTATLVLPV